ncbi:MAG: F0F1 ATP synthase subunit alpha [Roseburia sp.]|nr:F0F1 ATP synthase subunit alpha [Roseburia sp.]
MEIQYVIINFLILAAIIFLFCRKTIIHLFSSRREKILHELDEAEQLEKLTAPIEPEPVFATEIKTKKDVVEKEKAIAEERIAQIENFTQRECNEIHLHMMEKARIQFREIMKSKVAEVFAEEPYRSKMQAKEAAIVEEILGMIKLTPGDVTYIKHHDVLYVTLTSAYPLDPELVKKVDEATTKLVAEANSKTSLWVKTDVNLIGGLRLRIGDTVYDGTVEDELYHFEKRINKESISIDETAQGLLAEFKDKAENFNSKIHVYQLGRVMQISDGICWLDGLADIMYGEVIEFDCGERGMILDIQPDRIGCVVFGTYENIESGSRVRRVGRIASVPVGEALIGRVVDAIGNPVDGKGHISAKEKRPIECKAPGILDRAPVNKPLHTGIKAIDALVPIGKGQRELIIGDRQTGKTAMAIDAIINQKGKGTICIYVAIGKKETTIAEIKDRLRKHGAMAYTIIITASAADSAATQYIAPFSGTAMAEYFMYAGKDVLIIYDDLSKHAVAYRELSLLLHRPSGREAYPGDIFYLHSRLLERSAHLSEELGGGSITALPIIETLAGDISAYIPTNVISITDGQIFLESELFNEGQRPAINVGLSVSRVGGAAQTKLLKQMAASLRTKLAQYRELEDFTQLGSEVDEATRHALNSGAHLMEVLKQNRYQPIEDWKQALLLFAVSEGYADKIPLSEMQEFEEKLFPFFEENYMPLVEKLKTGNKANAELLADIKAALSMYTKRD